MATLELAWTGVVVDPETKSRRPAPDGDFDTLEECFLIVDGNAVRRIVIEFHEIIEPALHDALLQGIEIIDDDEMETLKLKVKTESSTVQIQFPRIYRMRFDNFLLGNIIFDMPVGNANDLSDAEVEWLCEIDAASEYMNAARRSLADCSVIYVTTSYGCSGIVALRSRPNEWTYSIVIQPSNE